MLRSTVCGSSFDAGGKSHVGKDAPSRFKGTAALLVTSVDWGNASGGKAHVGKDVAPNFKGAAVLLATSAECRSDFGAACNDTPSHFKGASMMVRGRQ